MLQKPHDNISQDTAVYIMRA